MKNQFDAKKVTDEILPDVSGETDAAQYCASKSEASLTTTVPSKDHKLATDEIRTQIEFYFSDVNLPTDEHMLEQIGKDTKGFVSLAHIMSFRRMVRLCAKYTVDIDSVQNALKASESLILSDDNLRVRRKSPLQDVNMLEKVKKSVRVHNLPRNASVKSMTKIFSACGKVLMVTFSGQGNIRDVTVEFEKESSVILACEKLNDTKNWRFGLRVSPASEAAKKRVKQMQQDKRKQRQNANNANNSTVATEGTTNPKDLGWGSRFRPRQPRRMRLQLAPKKSVQRASGVGAESRSFMRQAKGPDRSGIGFTRTRTNCPSKAVAASDAASERLGASAGPSTEVKMSEDKVSTDSRLGSCASE